MVTWTLSGSSQLRPVVPDEASGLPAMPDRLKDALSELCQLCINLCLPLPLQRAFLV